MKRHRAFLALYVALLLAILTTACQRGNGVQAAREERATNEGTANPGGTVDIDKNALSAQDRDVAFKIEQANIEEMDLGRFVRDKTTNNDVKGFAKMMVDDHNDALNKLQDILKKNNVDTSVSSKPGDDRSKMNTLQNVSGPDLDREYMSMMVQAHQKDLNELRNAEATVQNEDLKNYIHDLIPVVQKHLDKAQEIENNLAKTENR
jgi:putative membrane protein